MMSGTALSLSVEATYRRPDSTSGLSEAHRQQHLEVNITFDDEDTMGRSSHLYPLPDLCLKVRL
jgi:hypothetical protein